MLGEEYKLRYLPLFYDDVYDITWYISNELHNEKAADDLVDAIEKAILERLPICESFEPYHSKRERKYPYYRIYVNNYVVYYVVMDDESGNKIMEVRRLLHQRKDRDKHI